jgi:hypothetical protein
MIIGAEFKNVIMKVYCKDCKYKGFSGSHLCRYEDRFLNTGEVFTPKREKNLNGNCKHYKPLWWKFWLHDNGKYRECP